MADEPKSCPFCGCEMRVLPDINGAVSDVAMHEENECLLSLTGLPRDKFAAWNTRIEPEAADRGVSEAVRALFAEAHTADDCHQMMSVDPRVIIALQTELRHLEAEVQSLRSEQEGGHD